MELIGGIVIAFNFFLVLGIVGGMEHNTIPMSTGFWICMLIMGITAAIFKGIEIYQKFKNKSEKPLDKSKKMCYNKYSK